MGLSFHCFKGSWIRIRKRNCCSSSVIENQYLIRMVPERTNILSNSGTERKNSSTSSSVQKPMTRSTPARLYQLRSNRTISPPAGKCGTYLWKYLCVRSRSLGAGSATTRQTRGFRRWVIRLITPHQLTLETQQLLEIKMSIEGFPFGRLADLR